MALLTRWPLCLLLIGASIPAYGDSLAAEEYQVKAAFLFNFAKFVEWPPEALAAGDPIGICIVGNDAFAAVVKETVAGKKASSHGFVVRSVSTLPKDGRCHMLFVSNTERARQSAILHGMEMLYVLSIGESDDFIASGGVINLTLKDARIGLQVSPQAAARLKVRISSKLLTLSDTAKER
jgi:hypothetical protein